MSIQSVREDWKLFRSIDTLCQKAGVHKAHIPLLVVKELVDNALDACGHCELERVNGNTFIVRDNGDGIHPELLPEYFSINRPMMSSKLLRVPSRGALGNGLRVVTGAVIATGGSLSVGTHGHIYDILPQENGTSVAMSRGRYDLEGTSVMVRLGMEVDESAFEWGRWAIKMSSFGSLYKGNSSPYWYNSESFYELVNSTRMEVASFVSYMGGLSKKKEKELTRKYTGIFTNELTFAETEELLHSLRLSSKEIPATALGEVGDVFNYEFAKKCGSYTSSSARGKLDAFIPFVVEAWVKVMKGDPSKNRSSLTMSVNKTPVTADVKVSTKQASTTLWGGGLYIDIKSKPADIYINIITPYMPITSDGKEPDFRPMADIIEDVVKRAASKAKKLVINELSGGKKEKEIILENLQRAIAKTSGNGKYLFSQRQLYYAIRPYVMEAFDGKQPKYTYFCTVITDYESEYGEIPGMYRDPRGTLFHPHTGEEIPLGTIAVQKYDRPRWTFNKIIFIEKEGYFASLRDVGFPEKYDCALLSSKGYASRAVKDLFDLLGETDEEIQFFCVKDADAAGSKIYETLQEATKARPGRRVKVINLGLEPEEALEMGLQVETYENTGQRAVADYVDYKWSKWLQNNRVELNAMTTPEFIEWLENKMEQHGVGKIIPSHDILEKTLEKNTEAAMRQKLLAKIMDESHFEDRVKFELRNARFEIDRAKKRLRDEVEDELLSNPIQRWDRPIESIAQELVKKL